MRNYSFYACCCVLRGVIIKFSMDKKEKDLKLEGEKIVEISLLKLG